jgi:hypothetical protein
MTIYCTFRRSISLLGVLGQNQIVESAENPTASWWRWEFELRRSFLVIPFMVNHFFISGNLI